MFKPIGLFVLTLMLVFVGTGCATPTPIPTPIPTLAPPTAQPIPPTATSVPTATPVPPTATMTPAPTPLPTVTRTPTAAPTQQLFRRYYTGSFLVYASAPALDGCGQLGVNNTLDLDVVLVLVKYSATAKSPNVLTAVFVLAHQYFSILGIGSDNFLGEVYLAIGEDWDPNLAKFTRKNQYLRTTDRWMFFASPSCSNWVFTLRPGFGPDFQVIPENQFPSLQ